MPAQPRRSMLRHKREVTYNSVCCERGPLRVQWGPIEDAIVMFTINGKYATAMSLWVCTLFVMICCCCALATPGQRAALPSSGKQAVSQKCLSSVRQQPRHVANQLPCTHLHASTACIGCSTLWQHICRKLTVRYSCCMIL